jgi:hypothetical protein
LNPFTSKVDQATSEKKLRGTSLFQQPGTY